MDDFLSGIASEAKPSSHRAGSHTGFAILKADEARSMTAARPHQWVTTYAIPSMVCTLRTSCGGGGYHKVISIGLNSAVHPLRPLATTSHLPRRVHQPSAQRIHSTTATTTSPRTVSSRAIALPPPPEPQ